VFDNSKIKRFVPGYCATVSYSEGVRRTVAWFDADPARQLIDHEANAKWDKLIDVYERGLDEAGRRVPTANIDSTYCSFVPQISIFLQGNTPTAMRCQLEHV